MRELILILAEKETKRRLLAALFLVFFIGELGSHVAVCVNHPSADQQSISANEDGHDDPCKYLILCGNGTRKDQQAPNFSHDSAQYNALLERLSDFHPQVDLRERPPTRFGPTQGLFQPTSPPFLPPELS